MSNSTSPSTSPFVNVRSMGGGTWSVASSVGNFSIVKRDGRFFVTKVARSDGFATTIGVWDTREDAVMGIRAFTVNTMMGR